MDKSNFEGWLTKLGKAWSDKDPEAVAFLFSKDCRYYETVFKEPCESWDDILKLWQAVPKNQKNITFDFGILAISDNVCIANWKVSRTLLPSNEKQLIDGIFQISLNEDELCNYFKQWRVVK